MYRVQRNWIGHQRRQNTGALFRSLERAREIMLTRKCMGRSAPQEDTDHVISECPVYAGRGRPARRGAQYARVRDCRITFRGAPRSFELEMNLSIADDPDPGFQDSTQGEDDDSHGEQTARNTQDSANTGRAHATPTHLARVRLCLFPFAERLSLSNMDR